MRAGTGRPARACQSSGTPCGPPCALRSLGRTHHLWCAVRDLRLDSRALRSVAEGASPPRWHDGLSKLHSHCAALLLQEGGPGNAGEPAAAHHFTRRGCGLASLLLPLSFRAVARGAVVILGAGALLRVAVAVSAAHVAHVCSVAGAPPRADACIRLGHRHIRLADILAQVGHQLSRRTICQPQRGRPHRKAYRGTRHRTSCASLAAFAWADNASSASCVASTSVASAA